MSTSKVLAGALLLVVAGAARAQQGGSLQSQADALIGARLRSLERALPPASAVGKLIQRYRSVRLPARDLEDKRAIPGWFRAMLRAKWKGLPTRGVYQYPREARLLYEWMLHHPDLRVPAAKRRARTGGRLAPVTNEQDLSALAEINSESSIAVDPRNPRFVIAAANDNGGGSGRQRQFASADGGRTWTRSELPLTPGQFRQADPSVTFDSRGTAWAATLGLSPDGGSVVEVHRSDDHGVTWRFVRTVSTGTTNDREMIWADNDRGSPHFGNLYIAWDVIANTPVHGIRFSRSTDGGKTWSPPRVLSEDIALGVHLVTGPKGELYVGWPDVASHQLRVRTSLDGGKQFSRIQVIDRTRAAFHVFVPPICRRGAAIYLTLGVDRSKGPRRGTLYATWMDRVGGFADPGCNAKLPITTQVFISASSNAGRTWSPRRAVSPSKGSDQFNPWMDVDSTDGVVHVAFQDDRGDPARAKTNLFYTASGDGGATFAAVTRVSRAPTDETVATADGNQYGDYNGLAALGRIAWPSWTNRDSRATDREQVHTAVIRSDVRPGPSPAPRPSTAPPGGGQECELDAQGKPIAKTPALRSCLNTVATERLTGEMARLRVAYCCREVGGRKATPVDPLKRCLGTIQSEGLTGTQAELRRQYCQRELGRR